MSKVFKLSALILLLCLCSSNSYGFCKWTDSGGVTHYAESCPDEIESTEVQIQPPPTQAEIEASRQRSEQMQQSTRASREERLAEEEQRDTELEAAEETSTDNLERCAEARWRLQGLRMQLPVYLDDKNEPHTNESLHNQWYQGPRTYLDDTQRQAEILHYEMTETQTCTYDEADIRERIKRYMEKYDQEVCWSLEARLAGLKRLNTGLPSRELRNLDEVVSTRCNQDTD